MPAIDAHNHLGSLTFAGRWATATAGELEGALDASSIAAIVDPDAAGARGSTGAGALALLGGAWTFAERLRDGRSGPTSAMRRRRLRAGTRPAPAG
jgi:hypothetical protein